MTKKNIYVLLALFTFCSNLFSQVGINTPDPNANSSLHISERFDQNSTEPTIYKGVMIPRFSTSERDSKFTSLTQTDNGLTIYNKSMGCINVWTWNAITNSGSWNSLCGEKQGIVEFLDCSSIRVVGKYLVDKPLNQQNIKIEIPVNVKQAGNYSYTTNTVNELTFSAQGTFFNTGLQTVTLYPSTITGMPQSGYYNFSVTIAPTVANPNGVPCSNISVHFIKRSESIMKIINVTGSDNSSLTSSSSYASTYNWLLGTGTNSIGAPTTALSYSGTSQIQIVTVAAGNIAALSDALETASGIHVGANETELHQGFCNVIKEWQESTGGFVINFADKVAESNLANTLGFYVENSTTVNGITNSGVNALPQIFSTTTGQPFTIPTGVTVTFDGANAGQITTKNGITFLQLNNSSARKVGVIDLNRNIVIFGDKFKNNDMNKILIDLYAHFLKTAPVY